MTFSSKTTGAEAVARVFLNLPKTTRNKASFKALRAGGVVVMVAAAANVKSITSGSKETTGVLARGLAVYNMKKRRGMLRVGIMVRRKLVNRKKIVNGKPVRVGLYASVLEYGKKNQPPRSWLRKAAREKQAAAYSAIETTLNKNINSAVQAARK